MTSLAAAIGCVLVAVPGLAGGHLDSPWVRIAGEPEIDVSQGPNLTPPGFDAAFFAEQRRVNGTLEWRFAGRQAVAESFSAGRCQEPEIQVFTETGEVSLRLNAAHARIAALDAEGRAWSPGGSTDVSDVEVSLGGGLTLVAGELTLEAASGEAILLRPLATEESEPDPRAEVARLVLRGPIRLHGTTPAGKQIDVGAETLTLVARGGSLQNAEWIELSTEQPLGSWGTASLACGAAEARLVRLPDLARAACGGLSGAIEPLPAFSLGEGRYHLVDGQLHGGVRVSSARLSVEAEDVTQARGVWSATGDPVRVTDTGGSKLEAPRLSLGWGTRPLLQATGGVQGVAVAAATSQTLPTRWVFSGERLEASGGPAQTSTSSVGTQAVLTLQRVRLDGGPKQAQLATPDGSSVVQADWFELFEDHAHRTLTLSGNVTADLAAELSRGEPLIARADYLSLTLNEAAGDRSTPSGKAGAPSIASLKSLSPNAVQRLELKTLRRFQWGASNGQAEALFYTLREGRGDLKARGVDLTLAAVGSSTAAPVRVRADTLQAELDPSELEGDSDPLVRMARSLDSATLVGNTEVGRLGLEPQALRAQRLEYREHRLRANGAVELNGASPRGAWRLAAESAVADLDPTPEVWGQTRAFRKASRERGIAFLPPPMLRRIELSKAVTGAVELSPEAPGAAPRTLTLNGQHLRYDAESRLARLRGSPLTVGGIQGKALRATDLALWWTLLGERPLVFASARDAELEATPSPGPSTKQPSALDASVARAQWLNAVFYGAFPGPSYPPLAAWTAGGTEGVQVDGTGEVALRVRAPELHGYDRRVSFPQGPLELKHGEVELHAKSGALDWKGESLLAELSGGWDARFALPAADGAVTPADERYVAHGEALTLDVDLDAATQLQSNGGRANPELAQRALRSLNAVGGIEISGPNLRAQGDSARRDPDSPVTWLLGTPAQVQRGGLSYRGRKLELELR